jgi:hypothetical protein
MFNYKRGDLVKRLIIVCVTIISMLVSGCSTNTDEKQYYVLVVEGKENMIKKFEQYGSIEEPVIEIDYYKSVEVAKDEHPEYKIEETPVVLIFEANGKKNKKLMLQTHEIAQSLELLKKIKDEKA